MKWFNGFVSDVSSSSVVTMCANANWACKVPLPATQSNFSVACWSGASAHRFGLHGIATMLQPHLILYWEREKANVCFAPLPASLAFGHGGTAAGRHRPKRHLPPHSFGTRLNCR